MQFGLVAGAYLACVNIVGFVLMGWDKSQAIRSGWRVPEKTLLGVALIGGGIGVYLGMRVFRHKTKHLQFNLGVPAILFVQLALLGYIHLGS